MSTVGLVQGVIQQNFGAPVQVTAPPTNGYVLGYSSSTGRWSAVAGAAPSGAAGGDLGGTFPNPTVLSISNVTTGTLGATHGGSGQSTTTTGDLLVGGASNTWAKLAAGTSTYVLTSNGAGVAPSWQAAGGGTTYPIAPSAGTASAPGTASLAIGSGATVDGNQGLSVMATVNNAVAYGTAIGYSATLQGSWTGGTSVGALSYGGANYTASFGYLASCGNHYETAVGANATVSGLASTGLGSFAVTGNDFGVAVGYDAHATGTNAVSVGISTRNPYNSVALGAGSTTTTNAQLVAGSSTTPVNDVYFGQGVGAPTFTLHGPITLADHTTLAAGKTLVFTGSSSGTCSLEVPAAAGTSTRFRLPSTNGSAGDVLTNAAGDGILSWAAAGGGGTTGVTGWPHAVWSTGGTWTSDAPNLLGSTDGAGFYASTGADNQAMVLRIRGASSYFSLNLKGAESDSSLLEIDADGQVYISGALHATTIVGGSSITTVGNANMVLSAGSGLLDVSASKLKLYADTTGGNTVVLTNCPGTSVAWVPGKDSTGADCWLLIAKP